MKEWFNNLKQREQLIVLTGSVVVAVYLLFVLLWRPMASSIDTLHRQNKAAEDTLAEVKQLVVTLSSLNAGGASQQSGSGESLTRVIDNSIKNNSLTMSRFQPSSSGDVQVRFENSSFNNILAWLHDIEINHGVVVKDLSISPGSGSGIVNVSVRLRKSS